MSVAGLHQRSFFRACLVLCIIHEHLSRNISERGVEAACYQNTTIVQADGHGIRLQHQILRYFLFGPDILVEIVHQNEILVIGISKEVDL